MLTRDGQDTGTARRKRETERSGAGMQEKENGFRLRKETGYFTNRGVDVIAFEDIYPEGHQGGVSLLMHGERIATNGDVRFEPTPGQWQPVPRQLERQVDTERQRITTRLRYPDEKRHLTEYVLGGGSSRFMFLVLAVQELMREGLKPD